LSSTNALAFINCLAVATVLVYHESAASVHNCYWQSWSLAAMEMGTLVRNLLFLTQYALNITLSITFSCTIALVILLLTFTETNQ